jgi:hypothetical protein
VAQGGHALILPESLLGDEYNRRQPYLAQFGVAVRKTERPRATGSSRMVQGYDQSFAQDVAFTGDVSETLTPVGHALGSIGELRSAGVRQVIEPVGNVETLFRYPDGTPAVVQSRIGKGVAEYAASSLEERGYARLLDVLASAAGITRPIRVRVIGDAAGAGVEARSAALGDRQLIYIFNAAPQAVTVRVDRTGAPVQSMAELRESNVSGGNQVTIPAHQTNLYELF